MNNKKGENGGHVNKQQADTMAKGREKVCVEVLQSYPA